MNLESPFMSHLRRYRNIYLIVGVAIFLVVFFSLVYRGCDNWQFWREIEKGKENVNAGLNEANVIKTDIANLRRQEFEAQVNANQKLQELNRARQETLNQEVITNKTLESVNAIESANYANKTLTEALNALCKAFPESTECQ